MSDDESFLGRWSRRKRQARGAQGRSGRATVPAAPSSGRPQSNEVDEVAQPAAAEESAVLRPLPPIDSLSAGSDITAFLAPGVPPQLTRAALRRAWTVDPAIRDFVGLSENAWDFTAPDGVPGFGSLGPEDVRRLAEKFLEMPQAAEAETGSPAVLPARVGDTPALPATEPIRVAVSQKPAIPDRQEEIAAPQHGERQENPHKDHPRHRHGSALPQ